MSSKVLINGWKSKSGEVFYGASGKAKAAAADLAFDVNTAAQELSTAVVPPWSDADVLGNNLGNAAHAQLVFKLAYALMNAGVTPDATVSEPQKSEPQRANFEEIQEKEQAAASRKRAAASRRTERKSKASKVAAKTSVSKVAQPAQARTGGKKVSKVAAARKRAA